MGRVTPSPPRAVTACPAAMFLAAFTSAWPAKPQAVQAKRAWLSRDFASTCPHAEHRWLVYAGLIFSTRPGAFSCSRCTSNPQHDRRISRFSPAFWPTLRPGLPAVPLAERVMPFMFRSSTQITSNLRARSVLTFSAQVLAPVGLAGTQPGDSKPYPPAVVRPTSGAGELALQVVQPLRSGPVTTGACSSSPVDRAADTVTPRSTPTTWPLTGVGTRSGIAAKATCCSALPESASLGTTSRRRARRGTSGIAPTRPLAPIPHRSSG